MTPGELSRASSRKIRRPKITVIVPTYSRPYTLRKAIVSVLNQTYKDYEIVVVNDAGPDVEAVLAPLRGSQNEIVYLRHDSNRGLAAARNTGLRAASGKYVSYLDDDDIFFPDHLERLVTFLEDGKHKVAYSDAYRAIQKNVNGRYVVTSRDIPYSFDFDQDRILIDNFVPILCLMHEKSCVDAIGLFDESLRAHEDWDFLIRLSMHYEIGHVRRVTCEYRWRDDKTTMTSSKRSDFLNTADVIYERYSRYSNMPHLIHKFREGRLSTLLKNLTLFHLYSRRFGYHIATLRILKRAVRHFRGLETGPSGELSFDT
jgi:glycosyltransferase involved in cell wall biosynthesis